MPDLQPGYILRPVVRAEALIWAPFLPALLGVTHVVRTARGKTDYAGAEYRRHAGRWPDHVALVNYGTPYGRYGRQAIYREMGQPVRLLPYYQPAPGWLGIELPAPGMVYCDLLGDLVTSIERQGDLYVFHYLDDRPPRMAPDIELITVALPTSLVAGWQISEPEAIE